ncbi:MAG: S8 family serine peptidase [Hyphomicrobium sp.]
MRFDEGASQELVAVNLNAAEVGQVAALGFTVGPVTVAGTGAAVQRFRVPRGTSRDDARRLLTRQMPLTKFAPNHVYHIFQGSFGKEGDLGAGGAAGGGPAGYGGALIKWNSGLASCTKNVKVGIIDTSFDTTHPAFRHMKARNGEFLDGEKPSPYDWHGTAVLSLLAGDPKSSTPGLIPDATFFLATAFRSDESGNASTDSVRLLAALKWLEELDVDFVNMSFSGPRDALFEAAIQRMRKKGVVFIAAAGNLGPTAPPSYPAAYPEVIAVTAVDSNGVNYMHANRGSYIDVSAPGVDVLAALPEGKQGVRTGTSFATPFVTALVATRSGERNLSRRKADLLREFRMKDLGPPGPDPIFGQGLALAPADCNSGGVVASAPWGPAIVTPAPAAMMTSTRTSAGASAATTATDRASAFSPAVSVGFGFAP